MVQLEELPLRRPQSGLRPIAVCDGAGLASAADWSSSRAPDCFASLRENLWNLARQCSLDKHIVEHLRAGNDWAPLTTQQLAPFVQLTDHWLRQQLYIPDWSIDCGQSFRLNILLCLAVLTEDPDVALVHVLKAGVPTGVLEPLQPSGLWPRKAAVHFSNWQAAEDDPTLTQALIDSGISNGWVCEVPGGLTEARSRWAHIAVGKLNVVKAPQKAPRLVLDSTSCSVNPNCHLPESMQHPTVDDVRRAFYSSSNMVNLQRLCWISTQLTNKFVCGLRSMV